MTVIRRWVARHRAAHRSPWQPFDFVPYEVKW